MNIDISKLDFSKQNGLIPAVIQNVETLEVLMLGFMSEEAIKKTIEEGKVTFFSRTKGRLWQKGETSGNYLEVEEIKVDCDSDSLLILASPAGPTCHKGTRSCFKEANFGILQLFKLIQRRKEELPENSYTTSLFEEGIEKILEKVEEESAEVIQAARGEGRQRLIEESCDLIYHLFVLLNNEDITINDIQAELKARNT
ncbi:bifunctional phosphoribosyl-AMP cyclohydrolase/phosphoribosyl-ATP diphosphatase HisIE [Candidatus Peregrinibacteria bacterium]|jgi:phosphoribosyl-AMP cyclohydrolase / phosphoribosyl-ATP pyrophosphohydrolase|nr:bifunctional phosphoribosyl-AMP cyclohydrolase/phosphoribosyl-ATP diphosphatase HisIE [Candidatus Peregrinibacteria bacterium]